MSQRKINKLRELAQSGVSQIKAHIKALEELCKDEGSISEALDKSDELANACIPPIHALDTYIATFSRNHLDISSMDERGARFARERIEELKKSLERKKGTYSGVDTPNYLRGLHSELVMHRENMYPSLQYPRFGR